MRAVLLTFKLGLKGSFDLIQSWGGFVCSRDVKNPPTSQFTSSCPYIQVVLFHFFYFECVLYSFFVFSGSHAGLGSLVRYI